MNTIVRLRDVECIRIGLWVFATFILTGCAQSLHGGGLKTPHFQSGQTLLVKEDPETQGYGLYSYLLFDSPQNADSASLYQHMIWSCVQEIPDIEKLESQGMSRETLNVLYIPVTARPPDLPRALSSRENKKKWSQWIFKNYNYDRAKVIKHLTNHESSPGPHIVSILSPASLSNPYYGPVLVQDFSDLPKDNPIVAFEWVQDFVNRVNGRRNRVTEWNRATLVDFTNRFQQSQVLSLAKHKVSITPEELKSRYIRISDTFPDARRFKRQDDDKFLVIVSEPTPY